MGDEYEDYDEGSDIDNWEAEQCFQDLQAEGREEWDEEDENDDYKYDEEAEEQRCDDLAAADFEERAYGRD